MSKKLAFGAFPVILASGILYLVYSGNGKMPWRYDFQAALEQAGAEERHVIAYLFTDWCTYCTQMEATTFQDPAITVDATRDYIWVKLNAEKDSEGIRLRQEFGVSGYPTIVLLDPRGREIDRMEGYFSAADLRKNIEFFRTSPNSFGNLRAQAEKEPDSISLQFRLGERYLERKNYLDAARQFAKVVVRDPDNKEKVTDAGYYYLSFALASGGQPQEALTQIARLEEKYPESDMLVDAAVLRGQIHYYAGDFVKARRAFEEFLEEYPNHMQTFWVRQTLREIEAESSMPLAKSH